MLSINVRINVNKPINGVFMFGFLFFIKTQLALELSLFGTSVLY